MIGLVTCDIRDGISRDNKIPYKWEEDLKFFKAMTEYKRVLLGRKTYDTLPVLKNRTILCISNHLFHRDNWYNKVTNTSFASLSLHEAQQLALKDKDDNIVLCGGKQIYDELIPYCNEFYVSRKLENYNCDLFLDETLIKNCFPNKQIIGLAGGQLEKYTR